MGSNNKEVSPETRAGKRWLCAGGIAFLRRRPKQQPPADKPAALLRLRDFTADGEPIPDDLYDELGNGSCKPEQLYEAILEGNRIGFGRLRKRYLENGGKKVWCEKA